MGTILVADHRTDRKLGIGRHPALIVDLVEGGVRPLHHALGGARRLAEPDRRRQQEHVGGEDALAQRRPGIALAFVGGDAGLDVVRCRPDRLRDFAAGGAKASAIAAIIASAELSPPGFNVQLTGCRRMLAPRLRSRESIRG